MATSAPDRDGAKTVRVDGATGQGSTVPVVPQEHAYLVCIVGTLAGRRFMVRPDVTKIGRAETGIDANHIVLHGDRMASRRHATIIGRDGSYFIHDKQSRNRTYVNRHKLTEEEERRLSFGDEIEVGSHVFRFVPEGQWDYAPPRRAGSFWSRRGHLVALGASVVLALAAAVLAVLDGLYLYRAALRPAPLSLQSVYTEDVGLRVDSLDTGIRNTPVLVWLPGQRSCAVALLSPDSTLVLIDGRLGQRIGPDQADKLQPKVGILPADVNGDGCDELVFSTVDGRVCAVSPRTGLLLWRSRALGSDVRALAAGDVDGNGLSDVVVLMRDGSVVVGWGRGTEPEFDGLTRFEDDFIAPPAVFDPRGDGERAIVCVSTQGNVHSVNAGGETRLVPYPVELVAQRIGQFSGYFTVPAAVQRSGVRSALILIDRSCGLTLVLGHEGSDVPWAVPLFSVEGTPPLGAPVGCPAPVATDLNGDHVSDAVVALLSGPVVALDGVTGRVLWRYHEPGAWQTLLATPALYDFDKDGTQDVVLCDDQGGLHVLSGTTGPPPLGSERGQGVAIAASPVVGDVNGDGRVDIVMLDVRGRLDIVSTNSIVPESQAYWPAEFGSATHLNTSPFPGFTVGARRLRLLACSLLLVLLIIGNAVWQLVRAASARRLRAFGADKV